MVFTILKLGCIPRYSLERADSSETRILKIVELIRKCGFGIHDLSRCIAKEKGELFRLNMPLELGLDMGAKSYGGELLRKKKILILEEEKYRFQAAISDLSNSDIKAHSGKPDQIVRVVRDWLVQEAGVEPKSPTELWYAYNDCHADIHDSLQAEGYSQDDIAHFPEHEFIQRMTKWVQRTP